MVGKTISHYKILEEVSRGGMGIVYRALDVKLNREVALKVLSPDLVADKDHRQRFVQEAQATASLEHPHIAVIYDIDEVDEVIFIAMELLRGYSLADRMAQGRLPLPKALEMAEEIASGLAHAHDKTIIHRDLKPANVMVSADGHPKIIDFGLAKLLPTARKGTTFSSDSREDEEETALRSETQAGMVMGTVSYMSPEQARGLQVDHRSDIFSFGILLYHMIAGQPPFKGSSGLDILHGILKEPTPELPAFGSEVAPAAAKTIEAVVDRCLEKEPKDRYQSSKDVVSDLRKARLRLESSTIEPGPDAHSSRPWLPKVPAAAAALLLLAAIVYLVRPNGGSSVTPSKPSVAVLYFENNTGDPSMDWLRTALTDMLVTDLSQSPDIEVLSTDRLYQILQETNRLDDRITSFEVVQEVAEEAGVRTVLLGSFIKAGDTIRISARLQDASNGKIITTERVEGEGESNIFPMVDDLTQRIKGNFPVSSEATAELDRDLKDITTSSMEAYRHYAQGIRFHERYQEEEALPHFKKAVEVDSEFAMAWAKLGVVTGNLGRQDEADNYSKKALEHVDRLTEREKYYVEGWHYSRNEKTLQRAIDAYEKAIELYPDNGSARHNLAGIYLKLERHDEALKHLEELRRRRMTFPESYNNLAALYLIRGDEARAREVLEDYLDRYPESWLTHVSLGGLETLTGNLDQALETLKKAEQLGAPPQNTLPYRIMVHCLRNEWTEAEAGARTLYESPGPAREQGGQMLSMVKLYQGRSREILDLIDQALEESDEDSPYIGKVRNHASYVRLQREEADLALEQARLASGQEQRPEVRREGLARTAFALIKLGRLDEAEEVLEVYLQEAEALPSNAAMRPYYYLLGQLALVRGEISEGLAQLRKTESMLPPHGWDDEYTETWFALARAYLDAGDEDRAAEWFRRITESTTERLAGPIPYVRSLYALGKYHENRGEMDQALEYYRRFYEHWKNGDLDREQINEVAAKLP